MAGAVQSSRGKTSEYRDSAIAKGPRTAHDGARTLAGSRGAGGPLDERSRRRAQFLPAIRPAARRRAAAPDAGSLRDLRPGTAPARRSPVRRRPPRGALRRRARLSRRARARPALGGPELPGRLTIDSPIGAASGRPERAGFAIAS